MELLEAGRSVLWTQALHLRQDLTSLQERAPALAAVLEASRAILNAPFASEARLGSATGVSRASAAEQQMLEERRKAARDWDDAVDQIRLIEGFEHFLRPVPLSELRAAASNGPVVIVNISEHGSHALIVTLPAGSNSDPAVSVVELTSAPIGAVIDQVNALLGILGIAGDSTMKREAEEDLRHAVFNVLDWSWEAIAEPVVTALGYLHTPQEGTEYWPRVWWCPTGPATLLPLHAAGHHPRSLTQYKAMGEVCAVAESVSGRVISSYTPTLASLIRAQTQLSPARVSQLAVGIPAAPAYAPGASPLPAVLRELQVVARHFPPSDHAIQLIGPAATKQAVSGSLQEHAWLHLSCHGIQHPTDASLSAFFLYDQPLTLADLMTLNLHELDLAI